MNDQPIQEAGPPQEGSSVAALLSALPDIAMAGVFLITWISPYDFGKKTVSYLVLVMLFEFIVVHSAGFMGALLVWNVRKTKKILTLLGLALIYTTGVAGFAASFGQWWPVWAFWLMILNRLLGVLLGQVPSKKEQNFLVMWWGMSGVLYLLFAFVTTILPVPHLGISEEVVTAQGFLVGGLWTEEPHRVMAFGFLYFGLTGFLELNMNPDIAVLKQDKID